MIDFTEDQLQRYSRHILLKEVGVEGQVRLNKGRVLVVGAGGLGSPVALYLAAAGVGTIGIVDNDVVDLSNLQRQIVHSTSDIGRHKVDSASEALQAMNPEIRIVEHKLRLCADNVMSVIKEYDFIVDGSDNFPAKFLVNDACVLAGISFSHGGVLRFAGQAMTVLPGESACYRCVFRQPPPEDAAERVGSSSRRCSGTSARDRSGGHRSSHRTNVPRARSRRRAALAEGARRFCGPPASQRCAGRPG